MVVTCSQLAATNSQQATATEEEIVTVNYGFFDKSHSRDRFPHDIEVPHSSIADVKNAGVCLCQVAGGVFV